MRLGGRTFGMTAAWIAALSLLLVSPALSAAQHRHARSPAPQLRGAMITPNWSIAGTPFARTAAQQQAEIEDVCSMGGNLIRLHVDWSQLQPGAYQPPPPPADLPGEPTPESDPGPQPEPQPPVNDPGAQPTGHPPVQPASSLPVTYKDDKRLPGTYDDAYLGRLDQIMSWAGACHIQVIADVVGSPCWSIDPAPCDDNSWIFDPPEGGSFEQVAKFLLARYPDLYALEVWNEPNFGFWKGPAADYAGLVEQAVNARNQLQSHTLILAGAFLGDGSDYLAQLYAAGMQGQDGISIHPYSMTCDAVCSPFINPGRPHSPYRQSILDVHRVMEQYHDPGGLYLTEFGFATCPARPTCVTDRIAGRWLAASFAVASRYRFIKGLTVFSMRDFADPADPDPRWDMRSGIMSANLTPKPAFRAVKRELTLLRR